MITLAVQVQGQASTHSLVLCLLKNDPSYGCPFLLYLFVRREIDPASILPLQVP